MTKNERIAAFTKLGDWMLTVDENVLPVLHSLQHKNAWYTLANVKKQLQAIGQNLTKERLEKWLSPYPAPDNSKIVALVLAGNLPLVGFHDILSSLLMGFNVQIKASSDDAGLTTLVVNQLIEIEPAFKNKIQVVEKLQNFDLVIATGSNNTARYFEYYFANKPHIIRKNRNSVAVITGNESAEQLTQLGNDIFDYFGLGCRSVSKLFIPKDYNIATFFEAIEHYSPISDHYKYNNNYDYNKSIYLINREKHFDNGFLLLKEDTKIASPLAVVFYEEYENLNTVEQAINEQKEAIQCVVSQVKLHIDVPAFSFGYAQCPALDDYADGVDTLKFLAENQ